MNKKTVIVIVGIVILGVVLLKLFSKENPNVLSGVHNAEKVTIYKSSYCGCCGEHASYLKKNDLDVEIIKTNDMDTIKNKYKISKDMQSCHTALIGDYFVEGHVSMVAINKLLTEKPSIDGIALPEMPAGSPGMPGLKSEPFTIYSITDGEVSEFMKI